MPKRKKSTEKHNKALDRVPEKRRRGRPVRMRASEIMGRAENFRGILSSVWKRLWPLLSEAQTKAEVVNALQQGCNPYERQFVPIAGLILTVLREPKFPRAKKEARINFLADSLGALGEITARSSRDVCARERTRAKNATSILSYEFWITCSCGYKGKSQDHACPKCGAQIDFPDRFGINPVEF